MGDQNNDQQAPAPQNNDQQAPAPQNNDQQAPAPQTFPLCRDAGISVVLEHGTHATRLVVQDEIDEAEAWLPGPMTDAQILAIVTYGRDRYASGKRVGEATIQRGLRHLLDVPSTQYVESITRSRS